MNIFKKDQIILGLLCYFITIPNLYFAEELPKGLKWQTDLTQPIIENYNPKRGGEYRAYITSFPQTFRLYGPASNSGEFTTYNRKWALWSLVTRHPETYKYIPQLATHWAIMPDNKTVYYKLDQDAKWSDGVPITTDDYVFAYDFLKSPNLQDPFYNQYMTDHIASVVAIDKYTLKIVGVKESWQILDELDINPLPKHALSIDKDWIKKYQWAVNIVPGPYSISKFEKGSYIEFTRNPNWWGYEKRYYKEKFHFDKIRLDVIQTEQIAYEQFKKGNLSVFSPQSLTWAKKSDLAEIKNGYILKQLIYEDKINGARGIFFNSKKTPWDDAKLRQAFAYTIDFENLNKNFFYGLFTRQNNFFDVIAPYKDEKIRAYPFNLEKAESLLESAGWKRNPKTGWREKNGQVLKLTITTGSDDALRYLPYIKETAEKTGLMIDIQKLDGAQFYDIVDSRKFEALILAFGGGLFPSPRQFLHSDNITGKTNNVFAFGNKKLDQLIDTYDFNLNEKKRIEAISEIENILKNEGLYIPFWKEPAERILYWRYIKGPKNFVYKTGSDIDLWYYDDQEYDSLKKSMKESQKLSVPEVIFDPFKLKN